MVEFTRTVQIGWFVDDNGECGDKGMSYPHFRELSNGEPADPQTPDSSNDPDVWVEAFLRDMPNAAILYRERLKKWFDACWDSGWQAGRKEGGYYD